MGKKAHVRRLEKLAAAVVAWGGKPKYEGQEELSAALEAYERGEAKDKRLAKFAAAFEEWKHDHSPGCELRLCEAWMAYVENDA